MEEVQTIFCSVDVVLMTVVDEQLCVGLLTRDAGPFQGRLALPGGAIFSAEDVSTRDAAARTLVKKAGIVAPYLEQLGTFSGPGRDPRGWSIAVVYFALVPPEMANTGVLQFKPVTSIGGLPFDHNDIVKAAAARLRAKSLYSALPAMLLADPFTMPQLQKVYEIVLNESLPKVSFRRKILEMGAIEEIKGEFDKSRPVRPAQLYRVSPSYRRDPTLVERGLSGGWNPFRH